MKKILALIICLIIAVFSASCGSIERVEEIAKSKNKTTKKTTESVVAANNTAIDIDLTTMNSTMVYSEVYNMISTPDKYVGKIVKMNGAFALYENEEKTKNYYAVIIKDATACCSQGLEFIWEGEHKYPDDFPKIGSDITVVGRFETYKEGDQKYCHLISDDVTF
ncbi:MAG: hypothetical protein IJO19_00175 [Clostridia bacterium]|nr:hypothetical protein [Clostridia bacterium]